MSTRNLAFSGARSIVLRPILRRMRERTAPEVAQGAGDGLPNLREAPGERERQFRQEMAGVEALLHERTEAFQAARQRERHYRDLVASLLHQAQHDPLTGLPNKVVLQERLDAVLGSDERRCFALLVVDLDRFKEVNDTFGHACGDAVLRDVGTRLQEVQPDAELVARLDGDEFAVLVSDAARADALRMAERIRVALDAPFDAEGRQCPIGASVGIALYPEHGVDTTTLLRHADMAMYLAKRGHANHAVYEPHHDHRGPSRLTLAAELRQAIEAGQLVLHYQPKLNLKSGCDHHVEALVRWQHPERGLIPPNAFIPVAEDTGLIAPLTVWVIEEALGQCREWRRAGYDMSVAVNLSARILHAPWLGETVERILVYLGIEGSALEIEITESGVMTDTEGANTILGWLRDLGIRISIDDFGTGYSSLAYLKRLPVDELKIDRSFVCDMTRDESDAVIVRSVVDLGHNLGLQVTAEGVEDEVTLEVLAAIGCDMAQGYCLSQPLDGDTLAEWLATRPAHSHA